MRSLRVPKILEIRGPTSGISDAAMGGSFLCATGGIRSLRHGRGAGCGWRGWMRQAAFGGGSREHVGVGSRAERATREQRTALGQAIAVGGGMFRSAARSSASGRHRGAPTPLIGRGTEARTIDRGASASETTGRAAETSLARRTWRACDSSAMHTETPTAAGAAIAALAGISATTSRRATTTAGPAPTGIAEAAVRGCERNGLEAVEPMVRRVVYPDRPGIGPRGLPMGRETPLSGENGGSGPRHA